MDHTAQVRGKTRLTHPRLVAPRAWRVQRQAANQFEPTATPPIVREVLRSPGRPLAAQAQANMESRFGHDLSGVRVHTDVRAAESAQAVNALAYTVGSNVVFGTGQYEPNTTAGQRLLAHELTHVIQQTGSGAWSCHHEQLDDYSAATTSIQLQRQKTEEKDSAKQAIDYAKAERKNRYWASQLGWDKRLRAIRPGWDIQWQLSPAHFADTVAAFQIEQGFEGKQVNGILNLRTWDRLRPIGEVIAKQRVRWSLSESICYEASRERVLKGYKRATGRPLATKEEKQAFKIIAKSNPSEMEKAGIPKEYWGTSAAGALVYLGKGTFVSESDIWDNKALKPGAVVQVWKRRSDVERIKKGKKPLSWGTSAVLVEYVGKSSVRVRHFDGLETWKRNKFKVWIGANLVARETEESGNKPEKE